MLHAKLVGNSERKRPLGKPRHRWKVKVMSLVPYKAPQHGNIKGEWRYSSTL
jgi:hypothetical protein